MTAPLRVLMAHNRYRTGQPSGEDRVFDQEVALLRAGGHQVETLVRHSDDITAMTRLQQARVIAEIPGSRRTEHALARRIATFSPDVVHLHNTFPMVTASAIRAANSAGVPVVATLHNFRLVCPSGTLYRDGRVCDDCVGRPPWPSLRHGCYRGSRAATVPLTVAMVANRRRWWQGVETFFCISAAQRRALIAAGMPAERLRVKHNFVPDPARHRSGAGDYLLYLGRLNEEKGLPLLMSAWDRLLPETRRVTPLRIAGTGDLAERIAAWAHGRDDVGYLGLRDHPECERLIAGARAVVVPSVWPEAFGLVVVEAMAAGVPAVCAGHGAPVELISDGESGLLHEVGDAASLAACITAVLDPTTSVRMGEAARVRYLDGFTEQVGLAQLVAGYRAAIGGQRGVRV
jgi:glycosyltransferase involved in cell wall biosynthesis